MSTRDKQPGESRGSENARDSSAAFEDGRSRVRKITLNLGAAGLPAVALPNERRADELDDDGDGAVRESAEYAKEPAHLDAWTVDRVQRSSLPPSAGKSMLPPPLASSNDQLLTVDPSRLFEEGEGDALALAGRSTSSRSLPMLDLMSEMAERFALGDFSGCLRASELMLGQEPGHDMAGHYARESREKLHGIYTSRLTAQGRIPVLTVLDSEIRWLGLDPRVSFLISRIDGTSDYETLIDMSGMPRLEALRSLIELVEANVVRLV